jgi:hypothetical protein
MGMSDRLQLVMCARHKVCVEYSIGFVGVFRLNSTVVH